MEKDAPKVVKIHDVNIDQEYVQWLGEIKARYRSAQVKASIKVNAEQLIFNWQLGRDLVIRKVEERWGAGVVEQISLDLQAEFPASKGFSTTNLWYMKQWYQFYSTAIPKLQQLAGEFQIPDNPDGKKLQQLVGEIQQFEESKEQGPDLPGLFMCHGDITFKSCPNARTSMKPSSILSVLLPRVGAATR